jgi:hypothetical protein
MKMLMVRIFFCSVPAFIYGAAFSIISNSLGVIVLFAVFGLGLDITKPHNGRGEF